MIAKIKITLKLSFVEKNEKELITMGNTVFY